MKNILIIADNFTMGGLETQVYTYYQELKNKLKFTFVFGNYDGNWDFGNSKIYTHINYNDDTTINEFKNIILELVKIINENYIHA